MKREFELERTRDEPNHSWVYTIYELADYHASGREEKITMRAFYVDGQFSLNRVGIERPFGIARTSSEADTRLYEAINREFERKIRYNGDQLDDKTGRDIQAISA